MTADLVEIEEARRAFGDATALDGLSLAARAGEIHAVLGDPGAGKTTLTRALVGLIALDGGVVRVGGSASVPHSPRAAHRLGITAISPAIPVSTPHSALRQAALGWRALGWWPRWADVRAHAEAVAAEAGLEVALDVPVGHLSATGRLHAALLRALMDRPRVLVVDDESSGLSTPDADALFGVLRRLTHQGVAVLLMTRDPIEAKTRADRITVIRRGRVTATCEAAEARVDALTAAMAGESRPRTEPTAEIVHGPELLTLDRVTVLGPHGDPELKSVSVGVRSGAVLGFAGVPGSGQTALIELLAGMRRPSHGSVRLFGRPVADFSPAEFARLGVALLPEHRVGAGVAPGLSVTENLAMRALKREFSRGGFIDWGRLRVWAAERLGEHNIGASDPDSPAGELSPASVQRLIVARELAGAPELIVAAYPTRGLDRSTADAVRARLLTARWRGAAVVLFSDDLDELSRMADHTAVLHRGRLVAVFPRGVASGSQVGLAMAGHVPEEAKA